MTYLFGLNQQLFKNKNKKEPKKTNNTVLARVEGRLQSQDDVNVVGERANVNGETAQKSQRAKAGSRQANKIFSMLKKEQG